MKMRSLVSSLVLLAGGGCVVPHSLGTSEAESADGDGDGGSSTGGTGGVSMSDTGGGVGDDDGTSSGAAEVTTDPTAPSGGQITMGDDDVDGDGEESGIAPDECQPLGEQFLWLWDSMDFESGPEPLVGAMAVAGTCDVVFVDSDPLDPSIKGFGLACAVEGRVDGQDVAGFPFSGFFAAGGGLVQEALEARMSGIELAQQQVDLKFAQSNWGMGWNRWFVVSDLEGTVLFDGFQAEVPNPDDDVVLAEDFAGLSELLPWHGGLTLNVTETDCDLFADFDCGGVQQAMAAAGPELEFPTVGLEVGGSGQIEGAAGPLAVFLNDALDYSGPEACDDTPTALLRYAAYAP